MFWVTAISNSACMTWQTCCDRKSCLCQVLAGEADKEATTSISHRTRVKHWNLSRKYQSIKRAELQKSTSKTGNILFLRPIWQCVLQISCVSCIVLERNCGRSSFFSNNYCMTICLSNFSSSVMTSVLKSCAGYCGMWIDQVFREAEVAAMLQQLQLRRSAGEPGCEPESEKIPEISLARSVQFLLNFRMKRFDIIWRVLQKSIVSKSGFKQIAKTRWILQHFDGITFAKQNADRGTSFLTSMCFQRKNDWIFLRNLSIKPSLWKSSQARSCETQAACFAQWTVANQRTFDAFRFGRGTCPPKQMRLHNGYSSVLLGVLCVG